MTIQEQYTNTMRQGQEAWAGAMQSLTENAQNVFGPSDKTFGMIDPNAAIDQVFDFWKQTLEVQRDMTKQLVGATVATSEKVRSHVESVGTAVRDQAESVGTALRDQAESVGTALRDQAESVGQAAGEQADRVDQDSRDQVAKKYEALTKDELQEELSRRNLPKSGTVDELRERLIANDQH